MNRPTKSRVWGWPGFPLSRAFIGAFLGILLRLAFDYGRFIGQCGILGARHIGILIVLEILHPFPMILFMLIGFGTLGFSTSRPRTVVWRFLLTLIAFIAVGVALGWHYRNDVCLLP